MELLCLFLNGLILDKFNLSKWLKKIIDKLRFSCWHQRCLEAVTQRCSVKEVFLEISQNSQENTCARVSFWIKFFNFIKKETLALVFSCEFYEISKNNFFHRTPLVAASWCLTRKFFLLLRKQKQPPEVLCKNFAKFTEKHLWQRLFFNKVAGLRPATLLKKSFWHMCFSMNFPKFLRTPFLQSTSGRLLLTKACKKNNSVKRHTE